jgi:hypothetical protein
MTEANEYTWASPAQRTGDENRDPTTHAIHSKTITDLAVEIGEKITDDENNYIGLTEEHLAQLLRELHFYRVGIPADKRLLVDSLAARGERLLMLDVQMDLLRRWIHENTKIELEGDQNPVPHILKILNDTRDVVQALWPHLMTMWGNVLHVLRSAGLKVN